MARVWLDTTSFALSVTRLAALPSGLNNNIWICYIKSTSHYRQTSWVGDSLSDVELWQYSDADLAGDLRTQRSTSASHQIIWGPYTRAGQSMASRRQTCVSRSTLEAEIVAADLALRTELLAALPSWEILLGRAPK